MARPTWRVQGCWPRPAGASSAIRRIGLRRRSRGFAGSGARLILSGSKAGIVLAINGFGADGNSPYYRRDGALPLTGTMNANNQDIQNIGNMSGKTLKLQAGNSLNIGGAIYYGDGANAAVRTNGALIVQNSAGTASAPIYAADVNSSGTVSANAVSANTVWGNTVGGNTVNANVANINSSAANCGWNGVTIRNNLMYVCNKWGNWVGVSTPG